MSWFGMEALRQRRRADLLYLRCEGLEGRLKEAEQQREKLQAELYRERQMMHTLVDNALFAAGAQPIFDPGHERFRPRTPEQQQLDATRPTAPMSAAAWRRKVEELDRTAAERDRKARLTEELKALAQERRAAVAP